MARTIKVELSKNGISKAINELQKYKTELKRKTEQLVVRVANEISQTALSNFMAAVCDDLVADGPRAANVSVSVEMAGSLALVIAHGEDAVFCEFGAGVYHNGTAGSSPHPKGTELGLTIGSYGKGYGSRRVWGYYDENNSLVLTRGTPAAMPMYNAAKEVCEKFSAIAKEVFVT